MVACSHLYFISLGYCTQKIKIKVDYNLYREDAQSTFITWEGMEATFKPQ
jgi:hypothetical protein